MDRWMNGWKEEELDGWMDGGRSDGWREVGWNEVGQDG